MTIKDIAKLAGVSVSTVSRVLNDRPDVSEDSRRRVRAVIEAHKYVPNNSARDLVKVRSDAVGLVVRGVQNPFYTDIIHAIEQKLDASGYTMVMRQIPSSAGAAIIPPRRLRFSAFPTSAVPTRTPTVRCRRTPTPLFPSLMSRRLTAQ